MKTDYDELESLIQSSTEHRNAAKAAKEDFARATAVKESILEEWKTTLEQTHRWHQALQEAVAPIQQYHRDFAAIQKAFASLRQGMAPAMSFAKELEKVQTSVGEMHRRMAEVSSSFHQPLLRQAEEIKRIQDQLNAVLQKARQLAEQEEEGAGGEGGSNGV